MLVLRVVTWTCRFVSKFHRNALLPSLQCCNLEARQCHFYHRTNLKSHRTEHMFNVELLIHMTLHFSFILLDPGSFWRLLFFESSCSEIFLFFSMLSSSWNNSFTLWFVLAEVSMKLHPQREASLSPSVVATCWINQFHISEISGFRGGVFWLVCCIVWWLLTGIWIRLLEYFEVM